jgi:hypothetical protein
MTTRLRAARYGKDNVRVYKVHRDKETGVQTVVEMTVCVLLEGQIEQSCVQKESPRNPENDGPLIRRAATPRRTMAWSWPPIP